MQTDAVDRFFVVFDVISQLFYETAAVKFLFIPSLFYLSFNTLGLNQSHLASSIALRAKFLRGWLHPENKHKLLCNNSRK